jgi:hypothetical protein
MAVERIVGFGLLSIKMTGRLLYWFVGECQLKCLADYLAYYE